MKQVKQVNRKTMTKHRPPLIRLLVAHLPVRWLFFAGTVENNQLTHVAGAKTSENTLRIAHPAGWTV